LISNEPGENWTPFRLAAQVRHGGLAEIERALRELVALRYVSRLPVLGSGDPRYTLESRGLAALKDADED
jgi:hypothetical protein